MLVAITRERPVAEEAAKVTRLLDGGFAYVHLRHPAADEATMRRLIEAIPARLRPRLRLHDHHRLAAEYATGVHFNGRNPYRPGHPMPASASCHTLADVAAAPLTLDYVTLSPIYSSISKVGYEGAFTPGPELREAIKGRRVVALGGVTPAKLAALRASGFAGAAMLGAIPWEGPTETLTDWLTTTFNDFRCTLNIHSVPIHNRRPRRRHPRSSVGSPARRCQVGAAPHEGGHTRRSHRHGAATHRPVSRGRSHSHHQ